jgi:hypothetical protein
VQEVLKDEDWRKRQRLNEIKGMEVVENGESF